MKKIIARYTKGITKTLTRLNTQQKGVLVISALIAVTVGGFLIIDRGGELSLDINPTPGKPYAVWPSGNYLDVPYPHYWSDGINVKKYTIPLVVTWMADNGFMYVKIRAQKEELFSTYTTIFGQTVDWGDATEVTVAYNFVVGVAYDAKSAPLRVKLYVTDKRGLKFESATLVSGTSGYLDNTYKDPEAKDGGASDPSARINYNIWDASLQDPDADETPIPDADPEIPAPGYVPPPPPSGGVGIEDLFLISGLAVTSVVLYKKKKRNLEA